MKKLILLFIAIACLSMTAVAFYLYQPNTADQTTVGILDNKIDFTLEHIQTHSLASGTHRPEIMVEENKLFISVVEPNGETLHQGYIFDAADPTNIDFSNPIKTFVISSITDEYGKPADHRAAIINDELVVVYQTLIIPEQPSGQVQGPMEVFATSQSLMMARFDLEGNLISTKELIKSTDFSEDNFPDMCISPTLDKKNLLVSTGGKMQFKIREITLDGEILQTNTYETAQVGSLEEIGNSMFWGLEHNLLMFSGNGPQNWDITTTLINENFELGETITFPDEGESTFPTGIISYNGYYLVAYSSRTAGGDISIETNPLSPRLMILNSDFSVKEILTISDEPGQGHVHPTVAIIDDRLFYAWSKTTKSAHLSTPQVQIEEFKIK